MTTVIINKAREMLHWHDWCRRKGYLHGEKECRAHMAIRWPELTVEVKDAIYEKTEELLRGAMR